VMDDLRFQTTISPDPTFDALYNNFLNLSRVERIKVCAVYGVDYEESVKLWADNPEAADTMFDYYNNGVG